MTKHILFATGNERKLAEARGGCHEFNISVEQVKLVIDEIQSHTPLEITLDKVHKAYDQLRCPVVVTDTSWNFPALNGFPGGYMKDVAEWFTPNDFINLLSSKDDKSVSFTETIVYKDGHEVKVFNKEYFGQTVSAARGSGNSIEQVVEFDGVTLGERREQGGLSHDPKEYIWYEFAEWFVGRGSE